MISYVSLHDEHPWQHVVTMASTTVELPIDPEDQLRIRSSTSYARNKSNCPILTWVWTPLLWSSQRCPSCSDCAECREWYIWWPLICLSIVLCRYHQTHYHQVYNTNKIPDMCIFIKTCWLKIFSNKFNIIIIRKTFLLNFEKWKVFSVSARFEELTPISIARHMNLIG